MKMGVCARCGKKFKVAHGKKLCEDCRIEVAKNLKAVSDGTFPEGVCPVCGKATGKNKTGKILTYGGPICRGRAALIRADDSLRRYLPSIHIKKEQSPLDKLAQEAKEAGVHYGLHVARQRMIRNGEL